MNAAIKIEHISKEFRTGFFMKRVKALNDLNLQVEKGTVFGFLGPNGAGKTTTIKILMGIVYPTSGMGWVMGKEINNIDIKSKIGYLPENPYFYDYLKAIEFLDFYAQLSGMRRRERKEKIESIFDLVGLRGCEDMQLRRFSKGMLQRVGVAQAILNDPELIILDEPMSGLDPLGRKDIRDIILKMKDEGKTIFFSTHILSDAEMICDEIGILIKGRLIDKGPLEKLLKPKIKTIDISVKGIYIDKLKRFSKYLSNIIEQESEIYLTLTDEDILDEIIAFIQKQGGRLTSLIPRKESLEDLFQEKVGSRQKE
ncbi:MAG: ABC transporter ATP-binding protein [Nitrospirota bacterium]